MSFGPISLLVPCFKSSIRRRRTRGLKIGSAARVPAKPFGEDGIWNPNPIFEMYF
jgi:hypothetical protein